MSTPLRKRQSSPKPSENSPSKRRRKARAIIVISDSEDDFKVQDEDEELKDLLAQIEAHEQSEHYAKQLQKQFDLESHEDDVGPMPGSSAQAPIDIEDDAALAQKLAEKWAAEDDVISIRSTSEIDNNSSDFEIIDELPAKQSSVIGRGKTRAAVKLARPSSSSGPTPDESLLPYRSIFVETRPCSKCTKPMALPTGLVSFYDSLCPQSLTQLFHVACRKCKTCYCRGCSKELSCPSTCNGIVTNPDCVVHACCPEIRAIAIFSILEAFDTHYTQERASSETRTQALLKKNAARKATASIGPGGTGYGTGSSGGRGRDWRTSTSQRKRLGWRDIVIQAFKMLVEFLPAPYSDNPQEYDILPHLSIGHLIALSQLPSTLANLLRNDSVSDWISQKDTYNAMLTLLRRMADSELTIQCLIGPRWEANEHDGLGNWMRSRQKVAWREDDEGNPDAQPPLYTHFKKLSLQSGAFLKGAQQMLGDDGSEADIGDAIEGASLAGDIIAARDDLERAISTIGRTLSLDTQQHQGTSNSTKGKGKAVVSDPDALYLEVCEKLAFKYILLASEHTSAGGGLHYASFSYANNLKQTENSVRHPKDRLHLAKELAVTATSLPAGIWVRVDEVRNDAIKIMMAGPAGTPYAGGLFEFDCFMPIAYPNQPPLIHLRTTGGGSVRFNPNLYNCGKVCLSLLGTWPGRPEEQWTSKSTLLQVLVSIQSMILVEAPYFNEPGHGAVRVNLPSSVAYNRNICKETVRWAIVDWLRDEHRNGIWSDVIASHFKIHKIKIRQQIVDWIASAPEIRAYTNDNANLHYGQGGSGYRAAGNLHNRAAQRDLLAEFDKGMKLIQHWKTESL
ncbi:hypothetical protein BJ165DRAFT_1429721 [Panaeolus papilionaceus]|nr:hypothetical protein BJ165DRAFT_1429721 [Panaeolus papilionaceus]